MSNKLDAARVRVVLYEGKGSEPLTDDRRLDTFVALLEAGHPVTRVANGHAVAPADDSQHIVLGQFDELPAGDDASLTFIDIRGMAADDVRGAVASRVEAIGAESPGGWKPWFPVIDYDRCTNCMQCLTFCLFDVYGVENDKIDVSNEDHCKTDCPACSRVCPEAAIMFPKYKQGPINGAPVTEADVKSEAMKVDISALLGGDIYASLRARSKDARERFSTERDESKALLERKRCLKKLKKQLDIPDEVLMTLPSAGDIEERARRAREKAERRKQRSQTIADTRSPATEDDWGI